MSLWAIDGLCWLAFICTFFGFLERGEYKPSTLTVFIMGACTGAAVIILVVALLGFHL